MTSARSPEVPEFKVEGIEIEQLTARHTRRASITRGVDAVNELLRHTSQPAPTDLEVQKLVPPGQKSGETSFARPLVGPQGMFVLAKPAMPAGPPPPGSSRSPLGRTPAVSMLPSVDAIHGVRAAELANPHPLKSLLHVNTQRMRQGVQTPVPRSSRGGGNNAKFSKNVRPTLPHHEDSVELGGGVSVSHQPASGGIARM